MRSSRQHIIPPGVLGLNGVALTATTNSNAFGVNGFNQLMFDYSITDANASVTAITFFLQTRTEWDTTWKRLKISVAVSATGVETVVDRQFSCTAGATQLSGSIPISICHLGDMRIQSITGTGTPAAIDTLIGTVTLGIV